MSVLSYKNMSLKEFEKISKYKDLEIEIQKMWHLKTQTVPVIVGALGMIRKGTEKHLANLPGSSSLGEIQIIVLTSTPQILTRALT